jgi:hydrogenase maturation protein HypF
MCAACRAEYDDPLDRRFHAQPNACPDCGPALRLLRASGEPVEEADPLRATAAALSDGRIVAVKGLGGFHLACDAADERAVARLRGRKHREDKPFALMAGDLEAVRRLAELSDEEARLLLGPAGPIVIARRLAGAPVAEAVAPHSADLGVMLPYTPLHHLLLRDCGTPLVMTSGNLSDEPIAYEDGDAVERLGAIADLVLLHDRPIHMRTDDSVVRSRGAGHRPLTLRRSRGFVPESVELPVEARQPLLACGAQLKSTFCVAKGRRAWVGHHIGDLESWETLRSFREGAAHFERVFAVEPQVVVHDLHPDYLSTKYAQEREGVLLMGVQHHHAHLAACLAEHGHSGPALGAIFDGTGYGGDGTVWGGELLLGDLRGCERTGFLWPVRMPGGEAAIRQPWRMACAWLAAAGVPAPPAGMDREAWSRVAELVRSGVASPLTTSVGRLFDAVAAICGVRAEVNYEGQAAAELEALADPCERGRYPFALRDHGGAPLVLDTRPAVWAVAAETGAGVPVPTVAARFHNSLAVATAAACARAAGRGGVDTVVLSGGVFQNRRLLETTRALLAEAGLRVLTPEALPPNDGGIAYGQLAVAAARLVEGDVRA